MTIDEIINYVMHTPEDSNPAVLRDMLNQLDTGGGGNIPATFTWILTEKADNSCESNMSVAQMCAYAINGTTVTCQFTSEPYPSGNGTYDVNLDLSEGITISRPNQVQYVYIRTPLYNDLNSTSKFYIYYD